MLCINGKHKKPPHCLEAAAHFSHRSLRILVRQSPAEHSPAEFDQQAHTAPDHYRIPELLGLEGTSGDHPIQPLAQGRLTWSR